MSNEQRIRMIEDRHDAQMTARCTQCGDECPDWDDNDTLSANGQLYCEPCYEEMPSCTWCEEKIAPDEEAAHIEDGHDYHPDCLIEYANVDRGNAEENIPQLNDFLRVIAKGKEVA